MDANAFIAAEAILASKRLSVARLCRRADIAESTWHRLREGKTQAGRSATVARLADAFSHLTGQSWPGEVPAPKAEAA